jgi:nucleotide-binding universal stress UspA family protein
MHDGVDRISELAQRWKADLIVASTHARKGVKRWILGSFAETLLYYSSMPVFMVNPNWNEANRFRHILFPTDFSDESAEAFNQVLRVARTLSCTVTLFHKLIYSLPLLSPLPPSVYPLYMEAFDRELKTRTQDIGNWASVAKKAGVKILTVIDNKEDGSVADAILERMKQKPGFIALASRSGPAKTSVMGSTTRKLVRSAASPVWVLHPKLKAQAIKRVA